MRIAVDSPCADAVRAAVQETGIDVTVDEVGVVDRPGIERVAAAWREAGVSHAVAIERCGLSPDGRPRNMRGVDVSPWTAPLDDLFTAAPWVQDRRRRRRQRDRHGQAAGRADRRHRAERRADRLHHACDHLVVAGVSNWGAYGLMAALAVVHDAWSPALAKFLTAERDLAVTRAIVEKSGAVDGVTARNEPTVDGFPAEIHGALINELRRIAWGVAAD